MATLDTKLARDEKFDQRDTHWRARWEEIAVREAALRDGGGATRHEKQRAKGKMSARERVAALCDPGTELFELGLWAAEGMYQEYGGAPGAGVSSGLARSTLARWWWSPTTPP